MLRLFMIIKSDYSGFVGGYVKVLTPDGNLYGKLKEITDNNIVLNPHLDETYDSQGNKGVALIGRDFMYTRGAIRGIAERTKEEIKGLEMFAQNAFIQKKDPNQ